ncbi:DUF3784 domain-containing protein [Enterococcus sp. AZ109]|uniref:DUF3784 domain-containing protein n=1 Tax=Enterococcus sp. AZ109 TaxID=2774634 RepID=UPI003F2479FC
MTTIDYLVICFMIIAMPIIGIQLIRGKWLMLIAGYNTMGEANRAKVNGRNIGKLVGLYLLFIDLVVLLLSIGIIPENCISWLIVPTTLFVLIFSNVSKLFKQ